MRVTHNIPALRGWRALNAANQATEKAIERLSSGLRLNRAGDDVAGFGIAERMRAQIRGLNQSMRNVLDGISVVQVAEASLGEVSDMLQRARELAIYAGNGVTKPEDRQQLQVELEHILAEVNRVADSTEFNGRKLLGGTSNEVARAVDSLRRSWLANAEELIATHYGLQADGASLKIIFDDSGTHPAFVRGTDDGTGRLTNLELHINLQRMQNLTLPNGGSPPQYADRIIAHELVHAVMDRTMNVTALPSWFKEGAAEFIQGADERLASDLAAAGGVANLVNQIDSWEGTSADYSAGYAAVKYLHSRIIAAGGAGIRDLFDRLQAGDTLSAAIAATARSVATGVNFTDLNAFETEFKAVAGGQAFISGLNLSDADPGAIVPDMTAATVVPDTDTITWDPLRHFREIWPQSSALSTVEPIRLQTGPNVGELIGVPDLLSGTYELNLLGVDLVKDHEGALKQIDGAMRQVVGLRSELGAVQNRLEHTFNATAMQAELLTAAESRIRDLDFAAEMSNMVRQQVLMQASSAMIAQANVMHRDALRVLMGM